MKKIFIALGLVLIAQQMLAAPDLKVLVLFEGSNVPSNYARGDARQMVNLLGHFNTTVTIQAVNDYRIGEINEFDFTFFVGFTHFASVPNKFLADAYSTQKPLIWLNTGMGAFARTYDVEKRFGFQFVMLDTSSNYNLVRSRGKSFTKTEPNLNITRVIDPKRCEVLATAFSSYTNRQAPYIVRSGKFLYVADSPFASATETDRYLLFADMLHDILGEDHPESHTALLRIEDVNPLSNPSQLRDIADYLFGEGIPFLVSFVPFYVDPGAGIRVSISEKPDMVDAIHHMVERGGTIVLHGITHQYHGVTTSDYEFWDEDINKPIRTDSKHYVEKKIKTGVEECLKNNIYPLIWETPHYAASELDYSVIASFFTTAMEQRLVIEDIDYSQYFPYVIKKDMYGQKIIPENLGYVPLDDDPKKEFAYVDSLIHNAEVNLAVRDGYASAFFHPFVSLDALSRLVKGLKRLGYTFGDLGNDQNAVILQNRLIVSGNGTYTLSLQDQFLKETYIDSEGRIVKKEISQERFNGKVTRYVSLEPGWIYVAEPTEYKIHELTFWQDLKFKFERLSEKVFLPQEKSEVARVLLLVDPKASGGARNNQLSFFNAFRLLNMDIDSVSAGTDFNLDGYNLLIVPYSAVELLRDKDFLPIETFLRNGGALITDAKNDLAIELGVKFSESLLRIDRIRDKSYPEELISWSQPENISKFDVDVSDEVLCIDDKTDAPVAIARKYGDGRFIFLGARFDPLSDLGYSRFPYLLEHVRKTFGLHPLVRRENLQVYFEPGDRKTMSIEPLVEMWAELGVRAIHVASWHTYPKWTYDYDKLIKLCHANGILVYAWIEPPQVSKKFWDEHPEWREKNYKGEDLRASWRYPIALTDTAALHASLDEFRSLLSKYDWDGVNFAEICFEAGRGMRDPSMFSPFHSSARNLFQWKFGFDPVEIMHPDSPHYWPKDEHSLKQFENFRVDFVTRLHEIFLGMASEIKSKKEGFHIVLTVLDNLGSPELRSIHGIDVRRIAELRSKYSFTINVEDPQSRWSTSPKRYQAIAKQYREFLGPQTPFLLDLNILSFRTQNPPTGFPTLVQTGVESYALVNIAGASAFGVVLYSEASTLPQDLRLFPYALAANVKQQRTPSGWEVESPHSISIELGKEDEQILLDGEKQFSIGSGRFAIPVGEHVIDLRKKTAAPFDVSSLTARLLSISGELLELQTSQRSVQFIYTSQTRCAVTFNRAPYAMLLDGAEFEFQAAKGFGRFGVLLPPGKHEVLVVGESRVSYGVDITSLWSSSIIVIFGFVSGGVLLIFYALVRAQRKNFL